MGKIRILFDGDILKCGLDANSTRSGIFVATREILYALSRQADVDIYSPREEVEADIVKYVAGDPSLSSLRIVKYRGHVAMERLLSELESFRPAVYPRACGISRLLWLLYRANRWLLIHAVRSVLRMCAFIRHTMLRFRYDAFFTPVFLASLEIRASGLRRYTLLHDAIPMLFPQFYAHIRGEMFTNVLARELREDDVCFAISECTKRDYLKFSPHLLANRVEAIPLAASDAFVKCDDAEAIKRVQKKYGIPTDRPYFLSLCTVEPRKNLATVLKAFAEFIRGGGDANLVVAGGQWDAYAKKFTSLLEELDEVRDRIIRTGYVDDCDLPALYSGAMAFVYLSVYEGFGLPPLEAMKCGCPVLSSNTSSLPEVVGDAAITICPEDVHGVAREMLRIFGDAGLRHELSDRGLKRGGLFSWNKTADAILNRIKRDKRVGDKKILFDATIFQQGVGRGSRSGIFTVATELLHEFAKRNDVAFDFYVTDDSKEVVRQYLSSIPEFSGYGFVEQGQNPYATVIERLRECRENVGRVSGGRAVRFAVKGAIVCLRACTCVFKLLSRLYLLRIGRRYRKNYRACFSPVFDFPAWVRMTGLPRYIILYDVIPMIFPELYPHEKGSLWVEQVVDSLSPEDIGFAISKSAKEDFLKFAKGLRMDHVKVIPLAASSRFHVCTDANAMAAVRRKYGIPEGRPYFLCLSSIEPRKNFPFTIRAFARFAESNDDVVLVVAGKAWAAYAQEWESALSGSGALRERIVTPGYIDDEDLAPLYSSALAFVFLSIYEGFGLPPLEAMQCGCPVVCSNTSSMPEVVGDAALTVSPDDFDGAVDAMTRLASDDSLCASLRQKGIARAKLFSWDRAAEIIAKSMNGEFK